MKEWVHKHYSELEEMTRNVNNIKHAIVDALIQAWDALENDFLIKLLKLMKRRCEAVIKADGWYTKY